jgi:hypothetical protein
MKILSTLVLAASALLFSNVASAELSQVTNDKLGEYTSVFDSTTETEWLMPLYTINKSPLESLGLYADDGWRVATYDEVSHFFDEGAKIGTSAFVSLYGLTYSQSRYGLGLHLDALGEGYKMSLWDEGRYGGFRLEYYATTYNENTKATNSSVFLVRDEVSLKNSANYVADVPVSLSASLLIPLAAFCRRRKVQ